MEQIRTIPSEIISIIPKFEGDGKVLNLFIKKCEYILLNFRDVQASPAQDLYLFHCITSRLVGRAAALLSERDDICSWDELKLLLTQHFGDPRSENCIAIELETLKIKPNESYTDFCHRIQNVRSALFSKVNLIQDQGIKAAKMIIYNNAALNTFLYNLPEDLIRIIRLKVCTSLEEALAVVMEEENFQLQYNLKNRSKHVPKPMKGDLPSFTPNFFPNPKPVQATTNNYFNKYNNQKQPQNQNFRRENHFNNVQRPFQNNFKFGIPNQFNKPPNPYFNPKNNQQFNKPQNPFYYNQRPQFQQFKQPVNNQFKFGIPYQQKLNPLQSTDVSMRTVAPIKQNMINDDSSDSHENPENSFEYQEDFSNFYEDDCNNETDFSECDYENQNFQETASETVNPR